MFYDGSMDIESSIMMAMCRYGAPVDNIKATIIQNSLLKSFLVM